MTDAFLKAGFSPSGKEFHLGLRDGDALVVFFEDGLWYAGLRSDEQSFVSPGNTVDNVLSWCSMQGYLKDDPPPRLARNKYGDLK